MKSRHKCPDTESKDLMLFMHLQFTFVGSDCAGGYDGFPLFGALVAVCVFHSNLSSPKNHQSNVGYPNENKQCLAISSIVCLPSLLSIGIGGIVGYCWSQTNRRPSSLTNT
eukprot:TCALIF_07765-PA protein Name:"Protein of unknown function" AED:0.44 eAED:0.44 QI:0/0/0/0.66/0/0.33/3/0/110